jgi:uncharacterized protein (TIGR02246 family)
MSLSLGKAAVAASIALFGLSSTAFAGECTNKNEISSQFDKWNAALKTGNPETVADLYAKDGILLPTVSNKVRTDRAGIADYFHHFLELKPKGTLNEVHITCFGDVAINEGIYTFDVVRDGKPDKVQARYSFVYAKEGSDWKIVSHHSSKMPEPVK